MYRVSLANVAAHRTITPLHEKHQATPYSGFLDPAELGNIYSGMVAVKTGADKFSIADAAVAAHRPVGLFAMDRNPVINDFDGMDIFPISIWIGGPDAFFYVDLPAFDDSVTYTVPTDGSRQLLYYGTGADEGKLTTADQGSEYAVAELWEVVSTTRIMVRLFPPALIQDPVT